MEPIAVFTHNRKTMVPVTFLCAAATMLLFYLREELLKDDGTVFYVGIVLFPLLLLGVIISMKRILLFPDRMVIIRFFGLSVQHVLWKKVTTTNIEPHTYEAIMLPIQHDLSNLVFEMEDGGKIRINKWGVEDFERLCKCVAQLRSKKKSAE